MNDQDTQKQNKRKNKVLIILLLILIVICLAIILIGAYAKYVTGIQASADAKVADFVCTMDVTPCESSKENINSYCTVTVKNYDNNNHIAETDINFKVTVTSKDKDVELPAYKWYKLDSTENPDGEKEVGSISTPLQDTIPVSFTGTGEQHAQQQEQKYKIVFMNPGDKDVTKNLQFELDAVQKKPEQ